MTGQEFYDFLGALSEEEREREVRVYDGGAIPSDLLIRLDSKTLH